MHSMNPRHTPLHGDASITTEQLPSRARKEADHAQPNDTRSGPYQKGS